MRTIPYLG